MLSDAWKKAILSVLRKYIPADEFNDWATDWELNYSDQPKFGLGGFLKELYSKCDMPVTRDVLIEEMNGTLSLLRRQQAQSTRARTPAGVPRASDAQVGIFTIMYPQLLAGLPESNRMSLFEKQRETLRAFLNNNNIPYIRQLGAWLKKGGELDGTGMEFRFFRELFTEIYFYCCEVLGPVKADRLLSKAMADAAASPHSARVPPTDLIS